MLRDEGYRGSTETLAAAFLADYALATNTAGMFEVAKWLNTNSGVIAGAGDGLVQAPA